MDGCFRVLEVSGVLTPSIKQQCGERSQKAVDLQDARLKFGGWGAGRQDGEADGFWMSPADVVDKVLRFINKGAV